MATTIIDQGLTKSVRMECEMGGGLGLLAISIPAARSWISALKRWTIRGSSRSVDYITYPTT